MAKPSSDLFPSLTSVGCYDPAEEVTKIPHLKRPFDKGEYEELCGMVNAIAQPLAGRKLAKKLYKLIKKASKEKTYLRQGLSDVHKAIRRNETGIVILAGDVSPLDVYSHVPALCEEKDLPYVFTPSRKHLGLAAGHKRPSILLLVKEHEDYAELYNEVREHINLLPPIA